MPRKTNESNEKEKVKKDAVKTKKEVKTTTKKTAKSSTTKKASTAKKSVASKSAKNTEATEKTAKDTSVKKVSTAEKITKASTTKKTSSKTSAKKAPSKSNKKTVAKKTVKAKVNPEVLEYYDLPYRYNQTIVKILAQTPNTLFVYWDVSDEDKEKYINEYGRDFFEKTAPVLIVHNQTQNYSFEIEVNDFANSWYFNVNDADCIYEIELGRKLRYENGINIPNNYIQITSSNKIEAPNNHILFEKDQKNVFFRNVKTNHSYTKNIANLDFMKKIGTIYNIYEVYKKIYKNENLDEIKNPSSY